MKSFWFYINKSEKNRNVQLVCPMRYSDGIISKMNEIESICYSEGALGHDFDEFLGNYQGIGG